MSTLVNASCAQSSLANGDFMTPWPPWEAGRGLGAGEVVPPSPAGPARAEADLGTSTDLRLLAPPWGSRWLPVKLDTACTQQTSKKALDCLHPFTSSGTLVEQKNALVSSVLRRQATLWYQLVLSTGGAKDTDNSFEGQRCC